MSWGSFLLGGIVFGILNFFFGLMVGQLHAESATINGICRRLVSKTENLKRNDTYNISLSIGHYGHDDDDDDDEEEGADNPFDPPSCVRLPEDIGRG